MSEHKGPTDEHKGPKERLLDLFVYGPAGLALTAAEEFPKLVDKGRHRVEGQLHAARLVGQFAVQMGRRQVEQTVGDLVSRREAEPGAGAAPPASEPAPARGVTTALSPNGTMASSALGIPGYDSLSASQVVHRLGGLLPAELEAVRQHEVAHRHRRTILNRVEQLLTGAEPGHR